MGDARGRCHGRPLLTAVSRTKRVSSTNANLHLCLDLRRGPIPRKTQAKQPSIHRDRLM